MIPAVLQGFGPLHQQHSNTQGRLRSIFGCCSKWPFKMREIQSGSSCFLWKDVFKMYLELNDDVIRWSFCWFNDLFQITLGKSVTKMTLKTTIEVRRIPPTTIYIKSYIQNPIRNIQQIPPKKTSRCSPKSPPDATGFRTCDGDGVRSQHQGESDSLGPGPHSSRCFKPGVERWRCYRWLTLRLIPMGLGIKGIWDLMGIYRICWDLMWIYGGCMVIQWEKRCDFSVIWRWLMLVS